MGRAAERLRLRVLQIAKQYHCPGFHEPGTILSFGVNTGVWDSLSEFSQSMIETAAAESSCVLATFDARNRNAVDTQVNQHGVEV